MNGLPINGYQEVSSQYWNMIYKKPAKTKVDMTAAPVQKPSPNSSLNGEGSPVSQTSRTDVNRQSLSIAGVVENEVNNNGSKNYM